MKKMYTAVMVILSTAVVSACASTDKIAPAAPTATVATVLSQGNPGRAVGQTVVETLVVDAIDYKARTATLRDSDNELHYFNAGPEIRNFNQIKVGDEVISEHTESVAILVDKPIGKPAVGATQAVRRAALGEKPGIGAVQVVTLTALVEKIDYKTRMLTLKGPEGKIITSKVDPSYTRFNEVKKGDMVYINFTEEILIRVEPPKK